MSDSLPTDVLDRLMHQVHQRAKDLPPNSYTTKLIQGGVDKMGAKITEEAAEVVEAAQELRDALNSNESPEAAHDHLVYEACDLLYHLWTLLGANGISVAELRIELERREGTSGLEEKENRSKQS